MKKQIGELLRFGVVGGSAVLTDFCVYFALLAVIPLIPPTIAKSVSFIAGAVLAFVLNRKFVFRAHDTSAKQQVGPFIVLYLVSLGLNASVNAALLHFSVMRALAWFCATGTSTISNFLGMKFIVFRQKNEQNAH